MAKVKGVKKIKLTPGSTKTRRARAAKPLLTKPTDPEIEHPPVSILASVVVEDAPVSPGGAVTGALPRQKKQPPAHVKAALDRAMARSEGKDDPPIDTAGVDPALVREFGAETREERMAREDADTAKIDAKISPPVEPALERQMVFYPVKGPGGRPSSYKPEYCEVARKYCEAGGTDHELADIFDVSVSTIKNWRAEHLEFLTACAIGKLNADNEVERSLYQNAKGYHRRVQKVMQFQGVPFSVEQIEHVPGDVGAQKHWLANRKPDQWRLNADDGGKDKGALQAIGEMTMVELARRLALTLTRGMAVEDGGAMIDVSPDPAT